MTGLGKRQGTGRRTQDKAGKRPNAVRLIYAFSALVLGVFVLCGFLIMQSAGRIADAVHSNDTRNLVTNEVARQVDLVARDQTQISNWTRTLEALGATAGSRPDKPIDRAFVRDELAGWLFADFEIEHTVIAGPDDAPRIAIYRDTVGKAEDGHAVLDSAADLVARTRALGDEHLSPHADGFTYDGTPERGERAVVAADMRKHSGRIGIMVAQIIVPSDGTVMAKAKPHVMVTFRPLTPQLLADMGKTLGLAGFTLSGDGLPDGATLASMDVGAAGLTASWEHDHPSQAIWMNVWPLLTTLFALVGFALVWLSISNGRIIAALQRSEDENRFLALHDALTGLPNRLQFDRTIEELVASGKIGRCAVACIDLDKFKAVNDSYGHHAGDTVLSTVAERLSNAVGDAGMVARLGGDEFILLLHEGVADDRLRAICDDIIISVAREIRFDNGAAHVGASIGMARWPDDATTAAAIIRAADEALYRAKEAGRGRLCIADDDVPSMETPEPAKVDQTDCVA